MNRIKSNLLIHSNSNNSNNNNYNNGGNNSITINNNASVGCINLTTTGKNWFIITSTSDPIPAFDDDAPGQYSAFTHSLLCIDAKALDLSNFGKFVNRKFSTTIDNANGINIPLYLLP